MAPGVRYSALLIPQHVFLPTAHHIDGGGQDAPLGKAAQGSTQHSKDDRHRCSSPFTANTMVSYEISMMHSTASVTTKPNSVHCISIHPLYFSIEGTGLHVQPFHGLHCGDCPPSPQSHHLFELRALDWFTALVDTLHFGDGNTLPLPL